MASSYYEERIRLLLASTPREQLQIRISSFPDRNLAIALSMLITEDQNTLLSLLPGKKAGRVRQEQEYLGRLKVSSVQKRIMAEQLADVMEGKGDKSRATWIAPGRTGPKYSS